MLIAALSLATLAAFQLLQFVYVTAHAVVGHHLGASVKAITVGSVVVFRTTFRSVELRFGLLPTSASTEFVGMDDATDDRDDKDGNDPRTPFIQLPIASRALVTIAGPLISAVIGLFFLGMALCLPGGGVVVNPTAPGQVAPSAVPGLALTNEPATVESQVSLFVDTFVTFYTRLVTFQSLEGWGGFIGWLVTCGAAAAIAPAAWLTCFGTICVGVGAINLLPIPPLNGGHLLFLAIERLAGRLSDRARTGAVMLGLALILFVLIRIVICDVGWVWSLWSL